MPDPHARIRDHLERFGLVPNGTNEWNGLSLHAAAPTKERNYLVMVTSGLSAIEMPASDDRARYVELCMLLAPADLDLEWPMQLLRQLVAVVREGGRLGAGHTVAEDPPEPYANTQLVGAMLARPGWLGRDFHRVPGDPPVEILQVVPITASELALKQASGANALLDALAALEPDVLGPIDPTRDCTVAPRSVRPALPARRVSSGGARIVVPFQVAGTTAAIDALIRRAVRVTGSGRAYVRVTSSPAYAAHLIEIHGRELGVLAAAMSLVEKKTAAIRIHADLGCAVAYADGARVDSIVGTADAARGLVVRHLDVSLGTAAEPHQVRVLEWDRDGLAPVDEPNIVWSTALDPTFELAVARALLAPVAPDLAVRFGRWRRAHAVFLRTRAPEARAAADIAKLDVLAFVRAALPEGCHEGEHAMRELLLERGVRPALVDEFTARVT